MKIYTSLDVENSDNNEWHSAKDVKKLLFNIHNALLKSDWERIRKLVLL